ncbi:MAG TPA: haloalkane dehalogenase [Streptosporangiaceae bacterium]|jgi:haloalkane dehalogenase|nr:haloalkane dehalogenase [Streptosporangiaceae bacterium]
MTPLEALRTPDDRFADLPDFPYPPCYVSDLAGFEGLRAHYLDLGPRDADRTFLCLHGEPTWSYLYRKMTPVILESGARVVAPDLFGFGRSDKPVDDSAYTFHFHRETILRLVEHLALRNITLVVQDWGGTLGLTLPVDAGFRSRLDRLLVMNTVLPVGEPLGPHFYEWRSLVRGTPDSPVGEWMRDAAPQLTDKEAAAYDAPFPDTHFKAGVRTFPDLAMVEPEMEGVAESRAALRFWKEEWQGQSFMAIGMKDPDVETMQALRASIRGCPEPLALPDVGHFVQEDGQAVARAALRAFGDL